MAKKDNTDLILAVVAAAAVVGIVIAMRPTPAQTLAQTLLQAQQNQNNLSQGGAAAANTGAIGNAMGNANLGSAATGMFGMANTS